MELKIKLTEETWKKIFGAYVTANRSHWTGAPFEAVKNQLETKGEYVFGFESMGTWASKFRLTKKDDLFVAEFVKNPELPDTMKNKLDEMEQMFNAILEKHFRTL